MAFKNREAAEAAKRARDLDHMKRGLDWGYNAGHYKKCDGITKISFIDRGYEVFIVINAVHPDGHPLVAFDSAEGMYAAMVKVARKVYSEAYNWKEDQKRETTSDK